MEMKKILLDTNCYAGYLTGDEKVLDVIGMAETVYLSVIVIGELFAGFKGGTREQDNKRFLEAFISKLKVEILEVNIETSEVYAERKNMLKRSGNPIPINDLWIASQAIENGIVVVTYDKHFRMIPGLRIWDEL